jgi:hypothetical protein
VFKSSPSLLFLLLRTLNPLLVVRRKEVSKSLKVKRNLLLRRRKMGSKRRMTPRKRRRKTNPMRKSQ